MEFAGGVGERIVILCAVLFLVVVGIVVVVSLFWDCDRVLMVENRRNSNSAGSAVAVSLLCSGCSAALEGGFGMDGFVCGGDSGELES